MTKQDAYGISCSELIDKDLTNQFHHVLVVEDDTETSRAIVSMLEHLGHHPTACNHVQEAFELLYSRTFDLLLIDYRMPDMTGLDLILMLKHENYKIPAIMMTGYAGTEDRILAEKLEDLTILKKPISVAQLAAAMEASHKGLG